MDAHFPQSSNPSPNPNTDLTSTISLVKNLTFAAESAIKSLSTFFNTTYANPKSSFSICPYDPRHRVPAESLFRHSLLCSSSPGARLEDKDLAFLDTLQYPSSLSHHLKIEFDHHNFDQHSHHLRLPLPNVEVGPSSFFYRDCPGVVSFPEPDPDPPSSKNMLLLPDFLYMECADFVIHQHPTMVAEDVKILPSDFWSLRREVETWTDFPRSYSYAVLRVASVLDFRKVEDCGLRRRVICNSPRFGVLIDDAMRDHIFLLVKLCLKALQTEALSNGGAFASNFVSFDCPNLVASLSWLACQLSVLYGDANGKLFALDMLKESLARLGLSSLMFKVGKGNEHIGGNSSAIKGCEHSVSKSDRDLDIKKCMENGYGAGLVSVLQVAAAVAALHERVSVEERVRSLKIFQLLSKYQRRQEYLYASSRGCEVREKCPNYRAVSEYDSLRWNRGNDQDSGKHKTREELLAEERDYKRRRMSYRGKKVKRNPTEMLRDIIEEQMEEIKQQAGDVSRSSKTERK